MKIQITDELYEQLEMVIQNDGDRITIRQRNRTRVSEEWSDWKPPILNKREALAVHKGISDVMLTPRVDRAAMKRTMIRFGCLINNYGV